MSLLSDISVPAQLGVRWAGSGRSTEADPAVAGAEAVSVALAGRVADLVIVFCSAERDPYALAAGVSSAVTGQTRIVGCTSMGQFDAFGPMADGVVALALGGGFEVATRVIEEVSTSRRSAGVLAAEAMSGLTSREQLLLLLCDGLTFQQHEIVRGAHAVLGSGVPLVGACAADELTYTRTYQFHGDAEGVRVLSDSVVAVGVGSDGPLGVGMEHGWQKSGAPFEVTASSGRVVHELDGRSALAVYLESSGVDPGLVHDDLAFRMAAFARPLGMSRRSSEDIRVIHAVDADAGALVCLADVPQGALVWVMEADQQALIGAAASSSAAAVAGLAGAAPIALLAFDCGARRAMLSDAGLHEEVGQLAAGAAGVPLVGLYTYGEIARTAGSRGMHHLTCVTLAVG